MSDLIEREYLLNIARQEEAYGYVSEHEILNAPNAETTGALDDAIQEYIKDGYILAEPLVTVKAKQNEGLYLDTDEETLLETEYIVVATDGMYKEYIHETDGKPKVGKWEECKVVDIEDTTITEVQSAFCPICHKYHTTPYMYYFDYFNYCPNCGAKMERSE